MLFESEVTRGLLVKLGSCCGTMLAALPIVGSNEEALAVALADRREGAAHVGGQTVLVAILHGGSEAACFEAGTAGFGCCAGRSVHRVLSPHGGECKEKANHEDKAERVKEVENHGADH